MNQGRKSRVATLAALLLAMVATFAGCETKGPAEKAGEQIDQGIKNAQDAVTPAGPMEKAGENIDDALKK